ncbi:MAG: outer membrane protein transport protein [Deltaproteobacteria bacterium]|nr:outer membrane protein transport protein [Deltaproteobacteria bacterium]
MLQSILPKVTKGVMPAKAGIQSSSAKSYLDTSLRWYDNVICVLVLLLGFNLSATPMEDTFGAGARNKALAGAATPIADDYTAAFYNPALLALCRGSRLSVGYDFVHTGLKPELTKENMNQLGNYSSISMGFCLKPLNQVGIGLYSNFSMGPIEFSPSTAKTEPTYVLYGPDLKAFSMMASAGYAPIKQFAIGVGMSLASGVNMRTIADIFPAQGGKVSASFPSQITPILGGIVGVIGVPLEDWRLSLVYRSATFGQINIKLDQKLAGLDVAAAEIEGFLSYSPHQIALGSSYLLASKWLFTGDLTLYFWQNYPGPFLLITSNNFKEPISAPGSANFSNIVVPRFGIEYGPWNGLKFRGGYSFRPTPATGGNKSLIDASAQRVAVGLGYEFQLYQNIFLTADAFFSADILHDGRGSAINTGLVIGAEYD